MDPKMRGRVRRVGRRSGDNLKARRRSATSCASPDALPRLAPRRPMRPLMARWVHVEAARGRSVASSRCLTVRRYCSPGENLAENDAQVQRLERRELADGSDRAPGGVARWRPRDPRDGTTSRIAHTRRSPASSTSRAPRRQAARACPDPASHAPGRRWIDGPSVMDSTDTPEITGAESLVADVVDEFMERLRRGERPEVEDYARLHAGIAEILRHVLPALEVIGSPTPGGFVSPAAGPAVIETEGPWATTGLSASWAAAAWEWSTRPSRSPSAARWRSRSCRLPRRWTPSSSQRFKYEAQAAACLHHTHIVPVHAVGSERGVPFYAMQYIEGHSLAELIAELARLEGLDPVADRTDAPPPGATWIIDTSPGGPIAPAARRRSARRTSVATATEGPGRADDPPRGRPLRRPAPTASPHEHLDPQHGICPHGGPFRRAGRGGAGPRPYPRHPPPRHQAGQPPARLSGPVVGDRLRAGPDPGQSLPDPDRGRHGHAPVHEPRAGAGPSRAGRRPDRHLLAGCDAVRAADLAAGRRWQGSSRDPAADRRGGAGVPAEAQSGRAAGHGDVLLKAMSKDLAGRYATAKELADDLRRFLEHRPIVSRPPSLLDCAAKWAWRHRYAVWSGGGSLAALLVLSVVGLAVSNVLISASGTRKDEALREREARARGRGGGRAAGAGESPAGPQGG